VKKRLAASHLVFEQPDRRVADAHAREHRGAKHFNDAVIEPQVDVHSLKRRTGLLTSLCVVWASRATAEKLPLSITLTTPMGSP
jgi:hypothetical protein